MLHRTLKVSTHGKRRQGDGLKPRLSRVKLLILSLALYSDYSLRYSLFSTIFQTAGVRFVELLVTPTFAVRACIKLKGPSHTRGTGVVRVTRQSVASAALECLRRVSLIIVAIPSAFYTTTRACAVCYQRFLECMCGAGIRSESSTCADLKGTTEPEFSKHVLSMR